MSATLSVCPYPIILFTPEAASTEEKNENKLHISPVTGFHGSLAFVLLFSHLGLHDGKQETVEEERWQNGLEQIYGIPVSLKGDYSILAIDVPHGAGHPYICRLSSP